LLVSQLLLRITVPAALFNRDPARVCLAGIAIRMCLGRWLPGELLAVLPEIESYLRLG
jgi:hypothetical protein